MWKDCDEAKRETYSLTSERWSSKLCKNSNKDDLVVQQQVQIGRKLVQIVQQVVQIGQKLVKIG